MTRMLGVTDALLKVLLQGQRMRPAQAHEAKLVDELVSTQDELLPTAVGLAAGQPHRLHTAVGPTGLPDARRSAI